TGRMNLKPYAAQLAGFQGRWWRAEHLELVRSRLPVSGVAGERPRYETVAAWPLGAAPDD
ncbi:RNA 2',3'-cyclic phosphodiesterase, partial [Streptomyces sp. NPDC049577]